MRRFEQWSTEDLRKKKIKTRNTIKRLMISNPSPKYIKHNEIRESIRYSELETALEFYNEIVLELEYRKIGIY